MKNNALYLTSLIIFFFYPFINCKAQLINNKISVYAEHIPIVVFKGEQLLDDKNFLYPSLYRNYRDFKGRSLKILYNNSNYLSFGLDYMSLAASEWEYADYEDYLGSKINIQSLSPTIQFHNKYTEMGVFNRIKLYFEIATTIGMSELTLANPIFDIQSQNGKISQPMNSRDIFYGIKGNVGFGLSITKAFEIFFSYSIQQGWVKSKLYNDNKFSCSNVGLGLVIRLKKDKRFYY